MAATETRLETPLEIFKPNPQRTIEWLGGVSHNNLEKVLQGIRRLMDEDPEEEIHLVVSSFGGMTGVAMTFLDTVRHVLRPNLVTIGSGDVDSSGIIVFLAGKKRYITRNTTLLLHLASRNFLEGVRYSTADMEAMLKEDKLKDYQYACVLADKSRERYTPESILDLMAKDTILSAEEAVNMGLAEKLI